MDMDSGGPGRCCHGRPEMRALAFVVGWGGGTRGQSTSCYSSLWVFLLITLKHTQLYLQNQS